MLWPVLAVTVAILAALAFYGRPPPEADAPPVAAEGQR